MDIQLTVKAEECPYWDYNKAEAKYTCNGCTCAQDGNYWSNITYGIKIGKHRYCLLNCSVRGIILKSMR